MPHTHRSRTTHALAALASLLISGTAANAQEVVKVQDYPGLGNMLLRVAIAQKLCEKNGIQCEQR